MSKLRTTLSYVVVLGVLLSACVPSSKRESKPILATPRAVVVAPTPKVSAQKTAPRCPTVTSERAEAEILQYLESAAPHPGLDILATEWERLNDGVKTCRTGKAPS